MPEALGWLEKVSLAPHEARAYGGTHPTFVEVGSDEPLYVHRVAELGAQGRWFAPLRLASNPYRGPGSAAPYLEATDARTDVGDRSDTSPYPPAERPATYPSDGFDDRAPTAAPIGISVSRFIRNMGSQSAYLPSST